MIKVKTTFNPFALCAPLGGSQYQPTFGEQYLERSKSKHCFDRAFLKEYSASFLMVCRLVAFSIAILKLLMFKVCVIIGISKIKFFNFFGTERVKGTYILNCKISKMLGDFGLAFSPSLGETIASNNNDITKIYIER